MYLGFIPLGEVQGEGCFDSVLLPFYGCKGCFSPVLRVFGNLIAVSLRLCAWLIFAEKGKAHVAV